MSGISVKKETVSKASFFEATPKSPKGDLLKSNDIKKTPMGGLGVKSVL